MWLLGSSSHHRPSSWLCRINELLCWRIFKYMWYFNIAKCYKHPRCLLIPMIHSTRQYLSHWGRVTHICVSKLNITGSDNGLSPGRRQAIIWTSAGILLIAPLGTNFSEIAIGIQTFSFTKRHLKMASAKWRPFCLGVNVLTDNNRIGNNLTLPSHQLRK